MSKKLIIGTRGSELALWQAYYTQKLLQDHGFESELKIIKTQGDQIQDIGFDKMEGKGFFTKEIEQALIDGEIDLAVHSHKDLETQDHPSLIVAGVSERGNPCEALIFAKEFKDENQILGFKDNLRVGTSSARRKAQIIHSRPDVQFVDIRGNVPTRIEKLRKGECDVLLLAAAGIERLKLDLSDLVVKLLSPRSYVPAPAQGALAWQCRRADEGTRTLINYIHEYKTFECISIERAILREMEGGCKLPLGVYVEKDINEFHAYITYAKTFNSPLLRLVSHSRNPETIIRETVAQLRIWE
jgi:hydroxymethylbilane synthase